MLDETNHAGPAVAEVHAPAVRIAREMWAGLGGSDEIASRLEFRGPGEMSCPFPVMDLAAASFGVAGLAVSALLEAASVAAPSVTVDRRQASTWFDSRSRRAGPSMRQNYIASTNAGWRPAIARHAGPGHDAGGLRADGDPVPCLPACRGPPDRQSRERRGRAAGGSRHLVGQAMGAAGRAPRRATYGCETWSREPM